MPVKNFYFLFLLLITSLSLKAQIRSLTQSDTKVCAGEPVRLTATGCDKTVVWSNGMRGFSIVDSVSTDTSFTAVCMEGESLLFSYKITLNVEAIPKPQTPYLMCNDDEIKKGRSTRIKTFGCMGTVNWSNGEVGRDIKVSPAKTATYTAICTNSNNCSAEPISRTIIVYEDKGDLNPSITWKYGCGGESVIIKADGCTAGTYVWYKHKLLLGEVSTTEEIRRGTSVEVTEGGNNIFYTARCQFLECLGNESNRLQLAFIAEIDEPTVSKTFTINTNNPQSVDLTTAVGKTMTSSGVYEFRLINDLTAAKISDPTNASEAGTYYVVERSNGGNCVSNAVKIVVNKTDNNNQGTISETNEDVEVTKNNVDTTQPDIISNQTVQSTDTGAVIASAEPNNLLDELGIPGGFSPNGDRVNDVFQIKNLGEIEASFRVYNRYGHLVYNAEKYQNNWDGKPNNGLLANSNMGLTDGTYYYSLKLKDGRQKISFLTIAR
jgi:gliding motility-associated-like protein